MLIDNAGGSFPLSRGSLPTLYSTISTSITRSVCSVLVVVTHIDNATKTITLLTSSRGSVAAERGFELRNLLGTDGFVIEELPRLTSQVEELSSKF